MSAAQWHVTAPARGVALLCILGLLVGGLTAIGATLMPGDAAMSIEQLRIWAEHGPEPAIAGSILLMTLHSFTPAPAELIAIATGVSGMGWWMFLWTTGIGIVPITLLSIVPGESLIEGAWAAAFAVGGFLVLLTPVFPLVRRWRTQGAP